jgi:hypothetical protein
MIKRLHVLFLVLGLSFAGSSHAIIPENGWWWSASESGRGFNIEIQNNVLFFAAFAYEANGAPTWLTAGGSMISDRDFTGTLTKFTSGQCFGCAYSAPLGENAGNLNVHFNSPQTAVVTINGTVINVKRFDFWMNEVTPDAMLGEWSSVIGSASSATFDAERIVYPTRTSDASGPILAGYRLGSQPNGAVLAYSTAGALWTVILDSSATFYRYFEFNQAGFNRVEGNFWLVPKGGQPSGSGQFFQAYRTGSASFVQNGFGSASPKRAAPSNYDARDLALSTLIAQRALVEADTPAEPRVLEDFGLMEKRLATYLNR